MIIFKARSFCFNVPSLFGPSPPLNIWCFLLNLNSELKGNDPFHICWLVSGGELSVPFWTHLQCTCTRFVAWGTLKLPTGHSRCSLFYQERLLIREGGLLYLTVRRILEPGHPLVQLPYQVCGISGMCPYIFSGRYMVTGDPNKFLQQQLCNLLTWKYFWCLMIITRQLHASLLLSIKTGMGYN